MHKITGIIPAGGRAKRVHGFFKEMMPIGIDSHDRSKFIVSSEQIISSMLDAGAESVDFVLSKRKGFVSKYYSDQKLFPTKVLFELLDEQAEDLGMPYTIDSAYDRIKDADVVFMGMPDTIVEPLDAFKNLLSLLQDKNADLVLGLFRVDARNKGGFVVFDRNTRIVQSHIDKTAPNFPVDADNSWAIACWNDRFTHFLHHYLEKRLARTYQHSARLPTELLFGEVIDAAIEDSGMKVVADFIDEWHGLYWDITEPEKFFELLRYYDRGVSSSRVDRTRRSNLLANIPPNSQDHTAPIRSTTHSEVIHNNTSNILVSGGQIGNIGDYASNAGTAHNQRNNGTINSVDLVALSRELRTLKAHLQVEAKETAHYHSLSSIAAAEDSAKANDESNTLKHLKAAGKWTLDAATKIGTSVAAKAIEGMLNLP